MSDEERNEPDVSPIETDIDPTGVTRRLLASAATQTLESLAAAATNACIYHARHPRVRLSIDELLDTLTELCDVSGENEHDFGLAGDHITHLGRPLLGAGLAATRLRDLLQRNGIAGIRLARRAKAEDLELLIELLNDPGNPGLRELRHRMREMRPHAGVELLAERNQAGPSSEYDFSEVLPVSLYQSIVRLLESITVSVSTGGVIDFAPVRAQAEDMLDQLQQGEAGILQLARQEQYDAFTFSHSVRVSTLAINFARHLTEDHDSLIRVGTAALLHDVGKTRVPFELLQTRKPLSMEERQEISRHAEYGAEILIDHTECDACALAACFGHHIGANGSGYPKTEREHEVALVTRIISIVDVYEALTAQRPYKSAMSPTRAFRVMMDQGDRFDRLLLRRFIEVQGIYPAGHLVETADGRLGRVQHQTGQLLEPMIRLLTDIEGNSLRSEDQSCETARVARLLSESQS